MLEHLILFIYGYADQFGGPHDKKFMYKQFRELLLSLEKEEISTQKEILKTTLENWKGNLQQIDDILIIGMHII